MIFVLVTFDSSFRYLKGLHLLFCLNSKTEEGACGILHKMSDVKERDIEEAQQWTHQTMERIKLLVQHDVYIIPACSQPATYITSFILVS